MSEQKFVQTDYTINPPAAEESRHFRVVATKQYAHIALLVGPVPEASALPVTSYRTKEQAEDDAKEARGYLASKGWQVRVVPE